MEETHENRSPKIGAFVLETLTTGMYTNPLDTLREYVQNSFDAINEAERTGVLNSGAGRIEIKIDEKSLELILRDNGSGIIKNDIYARLVNIGMSSKDIQANAGFRGIGRLAGIAYCSKLVFKTQADGENDISTVVFDCDKIRQAMSPHVKQVEELSDVIINYSTVNTEKTRKNDHFFEVKMEGINDEGQIFLIWGEINTYLCQVAPIGLDTQSFHFAGIIHQWLKEHKIQIPIVSIILSAGPKNYQVFKPYRKLTYTTSQAKHKIHVKGINFFPDDADSNSPFWGWYAETNCPGIIGDETVAGIRLRKANIGVGLADRMTEIFSEASESYARFNKYFMGEIHIQDPNILPNARRDGFEDSQEWSAIRKTLVEFAHDRSREAYKLSQARNMDISRLVSSIEKERMSAEKRVKIGFVSKDEKQNTLKKIEKQLEKLDTAKKADRKDDEIIEIEKIQKKLQKTQKDIEKNSNYITQNLKSSLDKKQRKIISEIIALLYDILDEPLFEKARDAILVKYKIPDKEDTH